MSKYTNQLFRNNLLMALLGTVFLSFALISQHVFGYEPCTLCIEIRFWLAAAVAVSITSSLISLEKRKIGAIGNMLSAGLFGAAAVWAAKLVMLERGMIQGAGCSPFTFYHQTLPLHEWAPSVFEVRGFCGEPAMILDVIAYSELSLLGLAVLALYAIRSAIVNR
ncbi:disulfide bond formation protein B (plasmid) [Pseudomonas sp. FeN3W]|nr:disulfide bond formation protein B [Pseudomonas sp. FeN3W]